MGRPTIKIESKTYEMPRPTGGVWRKLMAFEKDNSDIFAEDFIEQRCEFLAGIYGGGLTGEFFLEKLYLEEITQAYREMARYIIGCLSAKLAEAEKNADAGDKKEK